MTNYRRHDILDISYKKAVDGIPRPKDPETKARNTAYKSAYNKQHYERFTLTVPKGAKKVIEEAARAQGESLNAYIIHALEWHEDLDLSGDK